MFAPKPQNLLLSFIIFAALALLALILAACSSNEPTVLPEVRFTQAAKTAEARTLQLLAQTPSVAPVDRVDTMAAPSSTPTLAVTATRPVTATVTTAGTAGAQPTGGTGQDGATYVADVTIPDNTVMAPGQGFDKTWRIRNTGKTTWTTQYSLIYIDGEQMGAGTTQPVPTEVAPGEELEITVKMTAPEKAGTYTSYWKMTNPDGHLFGFGPDGKEAIWVKIVVNSAIAFDSPTPTATGPAPAISAVSLSVDKASGGAPCPHTFQFTGQVTLIRAASVTYFLEVSDGPGEAGKAPPPATRNLEAGAHPLIFDLTYPATMSGWARLHVTAPVDLVSNQVNFSLACG